MIIMGQIQYPILLDANKRLITREEIEVGVRPTGKQTRGIIQIPGYSTKAEILQHSGCDLSNILIVTSNRFTTSLDMR